MIIAIDGPSGSGKSSVSKALAKALGFAHLDTGAMYRAFAYYAMRKGGDPEALLVSFTYRQEDSKSFIGDEDVSEAIRTPAITAKSSELSTLRSVREKIVSLQHQTKGDTVVEGRDIGTVVFPNAEIKVFLTASPEVRARRRHRQMGHLTEEEILAAQKRRDETDASREISPLRPADDAWILDTTELTLDEVVDKILDYVRNVS